MAGHGRRVGQRGNIGALAEAVVLLQDAQREVLQQLRLMRYYAPVRAHLRTPLLISTLPISPSAPCILPHWLEVIHCQRCKVLGEHAVHLHMAGNNEAQEAHQSLHRVPELQLDFFQITILSTARWTACGSMHMTHGNMRAWSVGEQDCKQSRAALHSGSLTHAKI